MPQLFYMYCVRIRSSFVVGFHNIVVLGSFASKSLQLFDTMVAIIVFTLSSLYRSRRYRSHVTVLSLPFASPVCVVIVVELFASFNVCILTFRCLLGSMHFVLSMYIYY